MKSQHPFEPFIPTNANKLIIGTIPPPRFCSTPNDLHNDDVNFYYGSKDNYFWPLLAETFHEHFEFKNDKASVDQRKAFLEKLNIGITDIIDSCVHSDNSAKDNDLRDIVRKDIKSLLSKHPLIDNLIYTSEFVKKQMNNLFQTYHSINPKNPKQQSIKIGDRIYKANILYSPSPLGLLNLGDDGTEKRKKQYRDVLVGPVRPWRFESTGSEISIHLHNDN
jgi:G:T/U-mismatch repair DNA glycosylase